jgi:hypothetical protein
MEDVGIFYAHLVYFTAVWYMYIMSIWYIFPHFGMLYQEKSGNPDVHRYKDTQQLFLSINCAL